MALKMAKPRTIVRGFRTYSSKIGDLLLALLLTRLLLTALLLLATLTGLWLTALLLLAALLTGFLVWILIHSSFLSNVASPLRSLVLHGKSQSAANAFVPPFILKQMCLELGSMCRVPPVRRTDDGTLLNSVVAWGANSDSGFDLAFWWPSLSARSGQRSCPAAVARLLRRALDQRATSSRARSLAHNPFQLTAASRAVAARVLPC